MISYYNSIDEIKTDTAIIPVGSIEQHGSHLPTGTDYFIIKKLSEEVAKRLDAYLLPPLPISSRYAIITRAITAASRIRTDLPIIFKAFIFSPPYV